jgi:predicted amidohydrolase
VRVGVVIAQIPVEFSVPRNLDTILDVLRQAQTGDIVLTPEGALTGYPLRGAPDVERLAQTDQSQVTDSIDALADEAARRGLHLWLGVCHRAQGAWSNEAVGLLADGTRLTYRKINLAAAERGTFLAGDDLPVFEVANASGSMMLGVQLCRELRYGEQWRSLAERGARLILHLNHGVAENASVFDTWRAMLVARAAENQRFVVSANAASLRQHCPSVVIGPDGDVLSEPPAGKLEVRRVDLDLDRTADVYLGQRRRDLGF